MPGFSAKHLDLQRAIAFALAEGKRNLSDAELTRIDLVDVFPDGHADLTLPDGAVDVRFRSPSHAKRDPHIPRGVPQQVTCQFRVLFEATESEVYEMSNSCDEEAVPLPRCTVAQVWSKALARDASLRDAVASIVYTRNIVSHEVVWMFEVQGDNGFSDQFPDDCRSIR